jgi:hypothetical protein
VDLVICKGSLSWWNKCFRLHIVTVQMKDGWKQVFKGDICKKTYGPYLESISIFKGVMAQPGLAAVS